MKNHSSKNYAKQYNTVLIMNEPKYSYNFKTTFKTTIFQIQYRLLYVPICWYSRRVCLSRKGTGVLTVAVSKVFPCKLNHIKSDKNGSNWNKLDLLLCTLGCSASAISITS